jgi:hypothetical protein
MNYIEQPCKVCEYEEVPIIDPIFSSNPLITPYYKEITPLAPDWYLNIGYQSNVSDYQLFTLTTRLRYEVPMKEEIIYKLYKYNDIMKYVVDIGDDGDKNNKKHYQQLINDIVTVNPNHCMFLHMNQQFISGQLKPLPNDWVRSIIPYCYYHLIDPQYDPILENNQILININPDNYYNDPSINSNKVEDYYIDYNQVYDKLQDIVINKLYNFYNHGVVVAHSKYNSLLIEKYNLVPLYNDFNEIGLYYTDIYIPNKTEYLINKLK